MDFYFYSSLLTCPPPTDMKDVSKIYVDNNKEFIKMGLSQGIQNNMPLHPLPSSRRAQNFFPMKSSVEVVQFLSDASINNNIFFQRLHPTPLESGWDYFQFAKEEAHGS